MRLQSRPPTRGASFDHQGAGAWTLGFSAVLYLALRGGGYDLVVYSEVGLAAWWMVLVGVLSGAFSAGHIGRLGWVCLALLAALAVWTGIAVAWSESAERTVAELGRVATYLGFFVLALHVVRRDTAHRIVTGIGVACAVVSLLAVLSRLYPGLFPTNQVDIFFPRGMQRLNYPLNYSDGTGNFLAIGIPLLLMLATRARTIGGQAVGTAILPVAVLGIVMTASRGAVITTTIAVVLFYALVPDRLPKLLTGIVAAAGSAIVVTGFLQRHAVRAGLSTPLAVSQHHQLTVLLILVCTAAGVMQVVIGRAARHAARPPLPRFDRRSATWMTVTALMVALVVAIAAGAPGKLSRQWQEFKRTNTPEIDSGNVYARLGTVSGSFRYQVWKGAVDAFDSEPLGGIGAGTFGFYWARHEPLDAYVLNPHSLYLQALAELGVVGFGLLAALLVVLLWAGMAGALRAPPPERATLAAATASIAAFCAAAGYDWMWQLPAAPVAALLLAGAILAHRSQPSTQEHPGRRATGLRSIVAALAVAGMIAIALPLGGTVAIRASQTAVAAGHVRAALDDAATAQQLEPYAATPRLQQALILEQAGDFNRARVAIAQATAREPMNAQLWLIRARIDVEKGDLAAAGRDYRRAHALDPLDPITEINA